MTAQALDILRVGITPLYIGFADVWNVVEHLKRVLDTAEWQRAELNQKHAVTCQTRQPERILHNEKAMLDFSEDIS